MRNYRAGIRCVSFPIAVSTCTGPRLARESWTSFVRYGSFQVRSNGHPLICLSFFCFLDGVPEVEQVLGLVILESGDVSVAHGGKTTLASERVGLKYGNAPET